MNAKQKLHQIKLQEWMEIFQTQAASGLTIKEWCLQNNISIHSYNYWKHKLKEEYVQSALPDIVPLAGSQLPVTGINSTVNTQSLSTCTYSSYNSLNSNDSLDTIRIEYGDIRLTIGSSVSEERILCILKAVRYA